MKDDMVCQMTERYTFDVPAIPDPEFVSMNPTILTGKTFEQEMLDSFDLVSDDLKDALIRAMNRGLGEPQKTPNDFPRQFFKWSGAQTYIDKFAVYDGDGRLDIGLTSKKIGIPYTFDMTGGFHQAEIVGLPGSPVDEPIEIHLREDDVENHRVSIGHEIGHYFFRVEMGHDDPGYNRSE